MTCDRKCASCKNPTTCIMCKGSNTEGENCKCKFGSVPIPNSLSCSDTFPGMSV